MPAANDSDGVASRSAKKADGIRGLHDAMMRYVDGDRRAYERLHQRLEPRLRGYLSRRIRDAATIDDLVQLTLLRAHLARTRFTTLGGDPDAAVLGWYYAIARNLAMDHLRADYRASARLRTGAGDAGDLVAALADPDPTVEELEISHAHDEEVVERVRDAISRLPATQREVVELHKLKGMSMAEVAERLAIREGAVRVRAHRAYRALARLLGGEILVILMLVRPCAPDSRNVHSSSVREVP